MILDVDMINKLCLKATWRRLVAKRRGSKSTRKVHVRNVWP